MERRTKIVKKERRHLDENPQAKNEKSKLDLLLKERDEIRKLTGNYDQKKESHRIHVIIKSMMYIFGSIFVFLVVLHKKGYF